jgi:sporadic carbohydrate cluster protein (TIGR04323 family)
MNKKRMRGYIFSRSFMGERVPQHVQNIVLRDYCSKNNLSYLLSSTEYVKENCHLMLKQVLNELKDIDGIAAYSLFQLPEESNERFKIYKRILSLRKEIHFSVENLKISKKKDIEKIENIWLVRQTLPNCLKDLN